MVGRRDSVLEIGIVQRQWSAGPLIPAKRACADKGRLSRMALGGQSSHVPPSKELPLHPDQQLDKPLLTLVGACREVVSSQAYKLLSRTPDQVPCASLL